MPISRRAGNDRAAPREASRAVSLETMDVRPYLGSGPASGQPGPPLVLTRCSGMRKLREVIDSLMTYTGVMFVLVTLLYTAASVGQVLLVLTGLLMVQLGVWKVAGTVLPSTRTNHVLRESVVECLALVRNIYQVANAQQRAPFDSAAEDLVTQTNIVIEAARKDLKTDAA